jgi:hypothetical protein
MRISVESNTVCKIVDRDSATLGLPASQEVKLYPNRTHRTICKFARRSEPEWRQIADIIASGAARAIEFTGYSLNMATRNMTIMHSDGEFTLHIISY